MPCLGENQNGGGNTGIGLEHAGRHRDNCLQTVAIYQFFTDCLVRGGRAEQHTIGNNAGAAPADFQHTQEQRKEKQFGFLGLADLQQVGGYCVRVQTALERRIGKNQRVFFLIRFWSLRLSRYSM